MRFIVQITKDEKPVKLSAARTTVGAVFGALAVVTVATVGVAHAEGSATAAGATEELPALAVKDFKYPAAECGSEPGLIEVGRVRTWAPDSASGLPVAPAT